MIFRSTDVVGIFQTCFSDSFCTSLQRYAEFEHTVCCYSVGCSHFKRILRTLSCGENSFDGIAAGFVLFLTAVFLLFGCFLLVICFIMPSNSGFLAFFVQNCHLWHHFLSVSIFFSTVAILEVANFRSSPLIGDILSFSIRSLMSTLLPRLAPGLTARLIGAFLERLCVLIPWWSPLPDFYSFY